MSAVWILAVVLLVFVLALILLSVLLTSIGFTASMTKRLPNSITKAAAWYEGHLKSVWRKTWGAK